MAALPIRITPLNTEPTAIEALADLLVRTVAAGGSVGFMHPLTAETARAFWQDALQDAEGGGRVVFGAWVNTALVGTLSLVLRLPPNQPHRAELAKMMTAPRWRGRGVASALLAAAEAEAMLRGRWLLVLDTASENGAARLYERHGWQFAGELPDYAFKPHGGLTGTRLYFKRLSCAETGGSASTASRTSRPSPSSTL